MSKDLTKRVEELKSGLVTKEVALAKLQPFEICNE